MHRACLCTAPPDPPTSHETAAYDTARVYATLHMLHTQALSRSPQTVPINTEAADQTCWSAACAYARSAGRCPYLAGVNIEVATIEL